MSIENAYDIMAVLFSNEKRDNKHDSECVGSFLAGTHLKSAEKVFK